MFKRIVSTLAFAAALSCGSGGASAQINIGEVALAQREVTTIIAGRTAPLKARDSVVQNQTVSTGVESLARIAFHDLTSVAIGPQATIKLDRFLYNPDATGRAITLNAARGAFRFVTGNTKSEDIRINTPVATIGVRGTIVDVLVQGSRVITVLRQGESFACQGSTCVNVTVPGTGLIITPGNVRGPTSDAAAEFNFDSMTANMFPAFQHPSSGLPGGESGNGQSAPSGESRSSSSSSSQH